MKDKKTLSLVFALVLSLAFVSTSYNIAWSKSARDKDYWYDQVGEHHYCFDTKKECKHEQNRDEIVESRCYNKDRM